MEPWGRCEIAGVAFAFSHTTLTASQYHSRQYLLSPPAALARVRPVTCETPRRGVYRRATPRATLDTRAFNNVYERVRARLLVTSAQCRGRASENLFLYTALSTMALSLPRPAICESPRVALPARPTVSGGAAQRLPHTVCDDSASFIMSASRLAALRWREGVCVCVCELRRGANFFLPAPLPLSSDCGAVQMHSIFSPSPHFFMPSSTYLDQEGSEVVRDEGNRHRDAAAIFGLSGRSCIRRGESRVGVCKVGRRRRGE